MPTPLTAKYWNERYQVKNTPWDIGDVSPPLKAYIDLIEDKHIRILIPGAGRAYEAIYLHQQGFHNVYVCDWATEAFEHLLTVCPDFPKNHLLIADFFELKIEVNLILEQTFFCAITPTLRSRYATKIYELLSKNGKAVGLLFAQPFSFEGPPFGGTKEEYTRIFEPYFLIQELKITTTSIHPRKGNELFFEFIKK